MKRLAAPRGQNLVLLALTMLFLALMVTMTIGLGLRIRQKHELQNLADAAAWSNAVMTARTFNNAAAINRLEVSYWVAQAADQSLISWTSYGHALANASHNAAGEILSSQCGRRLPPVTRNQLGRYASAVSAYITAENKGPRPQGGPWSNADRAAGVESKQLQQIIVGLRAELQDQQGEFYRQVKTQQLTRQIVAESRQDDISVVDAAPGPGGQPTGAAAVSMREVDCDFGTNAAEDLTDPTPVGSGLCLRREWGRNLWQAAMGSRGHTFLTSRPQMPTKVVGRLNQIVANYGNLSLQMGAKGGSAYWSTRFHATGWDQEAKDAWGDDHGSVTLNAGACSQTMTVSATLMSTDWVDPDDRHEWEPHFNNDVESKEQLFHTMGDCTPRCPSVWVRTLGFQPSLAEANVWGQPKVVVALERDLTMKKFPWELHFSFPFSATGPASEWDGRGRQLHTRVGNGTSIARQGALATGIAYYHRRDHWDEFPNLLNPFWRATLAPIDVDDAPSDMGRALTGAEHRWQRDAYQALRNVGYEGLH